MYKNTLTFKVNKNKTKQNKTKQNKNKYLLSKFIVILNCICQV